MLLAVQTPMGADLLGWTARKAGDNWVFGNASTLNSPRPKASDWDNVGMFGFSLGTGKAPTVSRPTPKKDEKPTGGTPTSTQPGQDSTPGNNPPANTPPERPTRDPRKLVPGGN
jgi:hypothetical protein